MSQIEVMLPLQSNDCCFVYGIVSDVVGAHVVFYFVQNSDNLRTIFRNVSLPAPERHLVITSDLSPVLTKIIASKKRILFGLFYENVAKRVVCEVSQLWVCE